MVEFQDSSVGRSWAHLLPQTWEIYKYIWSNSLWKRTGNWRSRTFTWDSTKDFKKGRDITLLRKTTYLRLFPEEQGLWAPPTLRYYTGKTTPKCLALETTEGYTKENYRIAGEENPAFKGLTQRITWPGSQWKTFYRKSCSPQVKEILEHLLERQEAAGTLPRG